MAYRKSQWIESFEGRLALLRPHLSARVLAAMSHQAWHRFGTQDHDPVTVARELSKLLDLPQAGSAPIRHPVER